MDSRDTTRNPSALEPVFENWLDHIDERAGLSAAQELDLARKARRGSGAALDRLVEAGLPRVVTLARDFDGSDLPLMDVVAEGAVGLIRAARTFDERRHGRFAPYSLRLARERMVAATGECT